MRKLVVTCQCGQRMQVPRSAVGKTGLCPSCGQSVTITNDNATQTGPAGGRPLNARQVWWNGQNAAPPEDARRKFGEAVDLYYNARYAEALAIFNALARQFPGNPDIENGRNQCMSALRRPRMALEHQGGVSQNARLDEETVRRVVLNKMLHGASETVQLQAAELAARMLGLLSPNGKGSAPSESGEDERIVAPEGRGEETSTVPPPPPPPVEDDVRAADPVSSAKAQPVDDPFAI